MDLSLQPIVASLGSRVGTPFAVVTPAGARHVSNGAAPAFTLIFRTERALAATFVRGHMGLLEAYFDQEVDLEGSLAAALAAGMQVGFDQQAPALLGMENDLLEWRTSNRDRAQAKANARAHYGLGEAFYRQWLDDPLKMYTCAYWTDETRTLEEAQRAKIDHVCRKLRLSRDDHFAISAAASAASCFAHWRPPAPPAPA